MTLFSCECHNPFDDKSTLIQVKAWCRITLLVNAISDSWVHESSAFGYDPVRLECANQLMLINPRWRLRSGIRILSGGTNPVPEPMLTCYQPDPGFIVKVISMPNFRPFLPCVIQQGNLRDLIAATGLVNLLKLDSNRRFFSPCDLEICGSKSIIFFSRVTLQFDVWPWKTTGHLFPGPLLCYFKLCASFRSHWWIQTGVTVRTRPIWFKIDDFFLAVWLCNLMYDLEKQ